MNTSHCQRAYAIRPYTFSPEWTAFGPIPPNKPFRILVFNGFFTFFIFIGGNFHMKFFSLLWVTLFVFVSTPPCMADQIGNLASEMATVIGESGKKAIAVADFTDLDGQTTKLGRFLAEEFSVALAASGQGFQVIDRLHLKSLIREHELSESGIIDTTTAQKLGNIAGVEALITGTLTPFGDTIRVTAKILDTETARIIGAMTGDLPKTGAFAKLVESEIREAQTRRQIRPVPAPDSPSQSTDANEDFIWAEETNEFKFGLVSCVQSGKNIIVSFLVESKEKDREYFIDETCRTFDNFGNEYKPSVIELGNKKDTINRAHRESVASLLIRGIPTRSAVTFSGVDDEATFLPLLEFGNHEKKFEIRNVPISK